MTCMCLTHFPTLATLDAPQCHTDRYTTSLTDLHNEFNWRFSLLKLNEKWSWCHLPFRLTMRKHVCKDVQLELINIQVRPCSQKKKKVTISTLDNFYGSLKETQFPNLHRHAQRMLVSFGSTYVCEQTFSVMNYNKSRYKSWLTDKHLSSVLRIANSDMTPERRLSQLFLSG